MGANNSTAKYRQHIYDTPPKNNTNNRLLFDPRSPSDEISRTPIQIDHHLSAPPLKLYNHVMPHITGPDITIPDDTNNENRSQEEKDTEPKRSSGVEPTLDPTKVLTALVANNNGQLPPYQL